MKFKVSVESLQYYLQRATAGLGVGGDTGYKFYFFTVEDGLVRITCTSGDIFARVQTKIVPEGETQNFDVDVVVLSRLLSYAEAEEISFDCDGTRVKVRCGSYFGSWVAQNLKEPIQFPDFPTEQPVDLSQFGQAFTHSINTVKLAVSDKVRFRDGLCYAGGMLRYQEVVTGFPKELSFDLLPGALDVVKFLRMNPGFQLKFAESESDLFFYDGDDVFVCPKAQDKNEDWKKDWDGKQKKGKQSYFTTEIAVLSRAIMRASLTSEEAGSSLVFEMHNEKLVISGDDRHGNHGEEVVPISLQGIKADPSFKRIAVWNWFVSALTAADSKAVTVYFDKCVGIVKSEKVTGLFVLKSNY